MRALLVWLLFVGTAAAQGVIGGTVQGLPQAPPRDPRAAANVGTGVISGRVTTADTGGPVRRAVVTLGGSAARRTIHTDAEGRYAFTALPPGTYSVMANPGPHRAVYLGGGYGQRPSATPVAPRRIDLADKQVLENIDIVLPRAGVITGRVTDGAGEPAANVQVTALLIRRGAEPAQTRAGTSTDDLGNFRLFGLAAGEYLVRAETRIGLGGPGITEPGDEATGFAQTYAPGTPGQADAMRVRVTAGTEASADVRLIETRVFTITGRVLTSAGDTPTNVNVSLSHPGAQGSSSFGVSMGPNGTFTFRNVPPGSYDITARQMPAMGPLPAQPPRIQEMGTARVEVGMADVADVIVAMRHGDTVSGEIAFDGVAPTNFRAQVYMNPAERRPYSMAPVVEVKGTTFTARGIFSPMIVRGGITGSFEGGSWQLKSVLLDGRDITDVPVAFTSAHNGRLQLLFTSASPALEGTVKDESGKPTREAFVLVFGADEESWVPFSSRLRQTSIPKDDGAFTLRGLREGRYYAVALPDLVGLNLQSPDLEMLAALKKVATEVALNPGETHTVELRVVRFEQ